MLVQSRLVLGREPTAAVAQPPVASRILSTTGAREEPELPVPASKVSNRASELSVPLIELEATPEERTPAVLYPQLPLEVPEAAMATLRFRTEATLG